MTKKDIHSKPFSLDEAAYPEMPAGLRGKLYEMGKPLGYKQQQVTQSINDFTRKSLIDLKNESKDSEEFYNKLKKEGYIKNPIEEFKI
ncbi:hypothetical protein [Heyndrickxia sporothermodurans]|uniref:hypothetical protein n=1 Tax=Heyndrickxia sporothermodurans TaxID=46224 RepID=UPI000D3BB13A|nr:hypothetical protein [Heyndrickxia sporothermodurans]PTY89755.1 hypothetical protein B5V90_07500 [Heyndrickxia sporothermodurans]